MQAELRVLHLRRNGNCRSGRLRCLQKPRVILGDRSLLRDHGANRSEAIPIAMKWWLKSFRQTSARRASRQGRQLRFESVEERRLMTATVGESAPLDPIM